MAEKMDEVAVLRNILEQQKNVVWVDLTLAEMTIASHMAALRTAHNVTNGIEPKYGIEARGPNALGVEHLGLWAEYATAKHLNLYWSGTLNDFSAKDVGGLVQVRSTYRFRDRSLILHDADEDNDPFVAAVVVEPTVYLLGWCFGKAGKIESNWQDPTGNNRPAYFVPNRSLWPMHTLKEHVHATLLDVSIRAAAVLDKVPAAAV